MDRETYKTILDVYINYLRIFYGMFSNWSRGFQCLRVQIKGLCPESILIKYISFSCCLLKSTQEITFLFILLFMVN